MTGVLTLYRTSIGKKVVMAVTGIIWLAYVFVHMVGNLKIYLGPEHLNEYALFLRTVGEPLFPYEALLWVARIVLLGSLVLHIVAASQLTKQDWDGRPVKYNRRQNVQASYASFTMRWGGVAIALFILFHVLHLTLGAIGYAPGQFVHVEGGEFQTYQNVVNGFRLWPISLIYILAMGALGMHLYHGTWSVFQTLGLTNRNNRGVQVFAALFALVVVIGNISIPIAVLAGIVQ